MTDATPMSLERFNDAPADALSASLRACAPIPSWTGHLLRHRPYRSLEELEETATALARLWTPQEVLGALAHHPRIGERAAGLSAAEAAHSAAEQAGVQDVDAWTVANGRYEERFGTVFLIRAAGRSQPEMLAELERRMLLTDEEEARERAEQLRQIALLRLRALLGR